jgi:hypothetical protein
MNALTLAVSALLPMLALVQEVPKTDDTVWHDARTLTLEGKAFADTDAPYDRLPARAQETVRDDVWQLSKDSAGMSVRFRSDASDIRARWAVRSEELALSHMPATGVSGVDLYVRDGGTWRWLGTGRPARRAGNVALLAQELDGEMHEFLLHLPLYNGTESLSIGVAPDRTVEPLPRDPSRTQPIVFYGTSITQGACASRPGMVHTAILGRRLGRPIVNMGFSGNGEMEPAVTALIAEIDAAAYVIDCLPNLYSDAVAERTRPLVLTLRAARPKVPILLVEDRSYAYAFLRASARERNTANRAALRTAYEGLQAEGVGGLFYLEGEDLLGSDGDATVDGSHPNDLGFMRQADAFEPVLREMLER